MNAPFRSDSRGESLCVASGVLALFLMVFPACGDPDDDPGPGPDVVADVVSQEDAESDGGATDPDVSLSDGGVNVSDAAGDAVAPEEVSADAQDEDAETSVDVGVDAGADDDTTEPTDSQDDGTDPPPISDACDPDDPATCENDAPCVPTSEGYACAPSCAEADCPQGWLCHGATGWCASADVNLCQPCLDHTDCLEGGGTPGDQCVPLAGGEGSYCATTCAEDADCPDGYGCEVVLINQDGDFANVCRPGSGTCECNWWGIANGAETQCGEGVCTAIRACADGGLEACEAPESEDEICDLEDNDCDGQVDEDFPSAVLEWSCDGADQDLCFGGVWVCDPASPAGVACSENISEEGLATQDELCDTEDNDCDGEVDEDYPDLGEICDGVDADSCANGVWICTEDQRDLICDEEGAGFVEICDGLDNDCDDEIDEDDVCGGIPFGVPGVVGLDGVSLAVSRTMDQGATWEDLGEVNGLKSPTQVSLTAGPLAVIYLGVYLYESSATPLGLPEGATVARSDDGGFTWQVVGGWQGGSGAAVAVCADPITGDLYGTDQSGNVRLSTDQGVTFEMLGSFETSSPSLDCEVTPSGDILILEANYCGDVAEDPCSAVWQSVDGGATFSEVGQAIANGAGGTNAAMSVSPEGTVYAVGGQNEVYTSDGVDLAKWTLAGVVDTGSGKEIQEIAAGPDGVLYTATPTSACAGDCDPATVGGHFFASSDAGATWTKGGEDWTPGGSGSGWVGLVISKYPPQAAD